MNSEYDIPADIHRVEDVIDRSRFITTIGPAGSPEAAREFIDAVRAEFPDATHNCWAYVAGAPGSTAHIGMSDAGEPHGTAGRPMLDVLLHSGVGDVVVVVTRYYGGVKLGKGGLVRAYGGCVQNALATMRRAQRVAMARLEVTLGYADVDALRRLLAEAGGAVEREQYGVDAVYHVALPASRHGMFLRMLADRTAGRAEVRPLDADLPD